MNTDTESIEAPHSRACGYVKHDHGPDCHTNCPTCHGKVMTEIPHTSDVQSECGCPSCVRYEAVNKAAAGGRRTLCCYLEDSQEVFDHTTDIWQIVDGPTSDDNTLACGAHLSGMLPDDRSATVWPFGLDI